MPKISENEVISLFKDLKDSSSDFSKFTPEIFIKNSQLIFILRLILNIPIDKFSEKINMSKGAISNWENKKHIPKQKSVICILNNFKKELKNLNSEDKNIRIILKRFSRFKLLSIRITVETRGPGLSFIHWQKIQQIALKGIRNRKRTLDETRIKEILTNENINFEEQKPIIPLGTTRAGTIVVDFLVTKCDTKFVIETTTINFSNRKTFRTIIKLLAHKGFRIKFHCPQIRTILVINTKNEIKERNMALLEEAFDFVILNDFNSLTSIINNTPRGGFEPPGSYDR